MSKCHIVGNNMSGPICYMLTCILQIKVRRVAVVVGMTEAQTEQIVIGGERSQVHQTAVSLAPS